MSNGYKMLLKKLEAEQIAYNADMRVSNVGTVMEKALEIGVRKEIFSMFSRWCDAGEVRNRVSNEAVEFLLGMPNTMEYLADCAMNELRSKDCFWNDIQEEIEDEYENDWPDDFKDED